MNHTKLIQYLIDKYKYEYYLEIGVSDPEKNYNQIKCKVRVGVDPNVNTTCTMPSDEFFEYNQNKFDLIFIDGLHHFDQADRDFDNAYDCLTKGGLIVIHDTNPEAEHLTVVPREKKGRWTGDVYKLVCQLNEYSFFNFVTLPDDNGCTVVWEGDNKPQILPPITWDYFDKRRDKLLRIGTVNDIFK